MRQVLCSLGLAASLVSIVSVTTSACTIDGKPSAFANNIPAVLYPARADSGYVRVVGPLRLPACLPRRPAHRVP